MAIAFFPKWIEFKQPFSGFPDFWMICQKHNPKPKISIRIEAMMAFHYRVFLFSQELRKVASPDMESTVDNEEGGFFLSSEHKT